MEPLSGAASAAAAAAAAGGASRPPSFASQTNALLRKNLIFQVQSMPILQFFRFFLGLVVWNPWMGFPGSLTFSNNWIRWVVI